jgi:flagellar hook assembly protein FlgD
LNILGKGAGELSARVEPNPMNPQGRLRFLLDQPASVSIDLYDSSGRRIRSLMRNRSLPAGENEVTIDGRSSAGGQVASGIYYYKITAGEARSTGRFTILK